MRLPVCSTRYWRSQVMTLVNSMNMTRRDADHDQRALGLVHHDLVDDHLGEQRRGEADELDGERGEQHVAPDALVLEQLGDEPAEAEGLLFGCEAGDFLVFAGAGRFLGDEDQLWFELGDGFFDGEGLGGLRVGPEVEELVAVGLEDEDGDVWVGVSSPVSSGLGVGRRKAIAGRGSFCQSGIAVVRVPVLKPSARAASWKVSRV